MNRLTLVLGIATAVLMVAVAFLLGRQSTALPPAPAPTATATIAASLPVEQPQLTAAAAPVDWASNPAGWVDGDGYQVEDIVGTCQVKVQGEHLMDGECAGTARKNTAFITDDPTTCSLNLDAKNGVTTAWVGSFRGRCKMGKAYNIPLPSDIVELGAVTYQDGCWVNDQLRVCFTKKAAA